MNQKDLRVIKTRNNIKSTFLNLLKKENGNIKNITVTELVRCAQISKGTFYKHYQDIYELYNEVRNEFVQELVDSMDFFPLLLSQPEDFLDQLIKTIQDNSKEIAFLWPKDTDSLNFCSIIDEYAVQKMYETCRAKKVVSNDIVMELIINSSIRLSYNSFGGKSGTAMEREAEDTVKILIKIINTFFETID